MDSKKPFYSKKPNPPTLVSELINHTFMTWKKEVVEHFFNHLDSEAILQIPLSTSLQKDSWAWHYERNGLFSVRSVYRMMIEAQKSRALFSS
jgi:hypothetical protein